ncbi:hypothetical protein DXG01_012788 [Tephrocybe rancida]|nr:hypothetical protein DXG01_012788 [Tephrocybe rancida]
MLSAIAARKAAQANRQDADVPEKAVVVPTEKLEDVSPPVKPSKRKSSTQNLTAPKRKREKRTPTKTPRYFTEEDSSKTQGDVIVIDSDGEVLSDDPATPDPTISKGRWSPSIPLNDSSDEEVDDISFETPFAAASSNHEARSPDVFSTFQPISGQNTFFIDPAEMSALRIEGDTSQRVTLVALRPEETLCLLGTYIVSVLQGSVTLSGVTLSSSPRIHRVFAPRSAPLPVLEGVDGTGSIAQIRQLPLATHSMISTPVALVLLQELRSNVDGLGDICRTFDNIFKPSRWQKSVTSPFQLSNVYMVQSQTKDVQVFEVPISWKRALAIKTPDHPTPVHFVRGPKRSGKSTFARTLVNSLLVRYQKVAYLECDLGQSEFTPGGMVALNVISTPLFGPPFTHPTLPISAHYIGATTPRSSPSHYLAAVQAIIETYRLDVQTPAISWQTDEEDTRISEYIPLVVNTMGWNKGLGADLTAKLQDIAEPTDIYEIESPFDPAWPTPAPRDTYLAPSSHPTKLHLIKPAPTSALSDNYSAADHRSLSIMSYLHAVFPSCPPPADDLSQTTALSWNTSLPLCAQSPFEVDCAQSFDKIILTGAGTEDVVSSEVARVLNGALAALVSCTPGTLDVDLDTESAISHFPYTQGFAAPSPASSRCLGLALVRSVSPELPMKLHVLTPIPHSLLVDGRVLVKGELELPIWGMLDHTSNGGQVAGVENEKVPFLQWGKGEGVGGEKRRIRRNLMRRGQM